MIAASQFVELVLSVRCCRDHGTWKEMTVVNSPSLVFAKKQFDTGYLLISLLI